jgi:hypothetical protein
MALVDSCNSGSHPENYKVSTFVVGLGTSATSATSEVPRMSVLEGGVHSMPLKSALGRRTLP